MPQVVQAVVAAVTAIITAIGVPAAVAQTIATIVVQIAITSAVNAVTRALQPKPRGMEQGITLQTKVDSAYPREVAVGKFATGGSLVFENVEGSNNKNLWRVIAISDAQIEEVTQIRGNGEALTFSGDIHTGLRVCTSHFQTASGGDMLSVRVYKGTQSQTADADLLAAFPSLLDSNFRGRGMAYVIMKMTWDPDAWSSGAEFVFVGKGALLEDTRTATTAWSENAVMIAREYIKGFENNGVRVVGLGCDEDDDLAADDIDAALDEADDAISLLAGGTEARYRAGGMISARESAREVLGELAAAFAGTHVDVGGQITLLPGVARTPILDVSEDDLLADEPFVYAGKRTADERVNCINSTFVSPDDGWQEASLPPRKDASAISIDGARYETSRAYRFVYSKTQGQRLDEIILRRSRLEAFVAFTAPLWAFELTPGDWFTMTNKRWGGVEKTFEVETVQLAIISGAAGGAPRARCAVTAREISSDVYDWSTADEITVAGSVVTQPSALASLVDETGRIITVDGLPIGALGGVGMVHSESSPLSAASASQIDVAADDVTFVGRVYELPSASITGLSTDTLYFVFWDIEADDYVHSTDAATITSYYTDTANYIPMGYQRTQDGGGGYTPPPPPPPGGGGGYSSGAGGGAIP